MKKILIIFIAGILVAATLLLLLINLRGLPDTLRQEGPPIPTLWAAAKLLCTRAKVMPIGNDSRHLLQRGNTWQPFIEYMAQDGWELMGDGYPARSFFTKDGNVLGVHRRPWSRFFSVYRTENDPR